MKPENPNYKLLDVYAKEQNYEQLLKLLKPLIHKFKVKYNKIQCPELEKELIQCGRIGLHEAMVKHDPERGAFFNTAYTYIKKEMLVHIQNNSRTIRIPVNQQREDKQNLKYPTHVPVISLDEPVGEDLSLHDILGSETIDNSLDDTQLQLYKMVQENLFKLRPVQREAVWSYLIDGKTFDEMGEATGTTRQAAYQAYWTGLQNLQKMMGIEVIGSKGHSNKILNNRKKDEE